MRTREHGLSIRDDAELNRCIEERYRKIPKVNFGPEQAQYLEQNPNIEAVELADFISNVHPHLRGTPIPDMARDLLISIKTPPLTRRYSPENDKRKHAPGTNAILRGSALKKHELGHPLNGYDNIHKFYPRDTRIHWFGSPYPVHKKVMEKLRHPPVEIDLRTVVPKLGNDQYDLWVEKQLDNVFIYKYGLDPEYFASWRSFYAHEHGKPWWDDYINIHTDCHWIGKQTYQRRQLSIQFFLEGREVLVVDLLDIPNSNLADDLRLHKNGSRFEDISRADLLVGENDVILFNKKNLEQYHYEHRGVRLPFQPLYGLRVGDMIREVGSKILWPGKEERYDIRPIMEQMRKAGLSKSYPHDKVHEPAEDGAMYKLPDQSDKQYLESKQATLISDLALYASYDPFLYIFLGYETGVFDYVPLGDILNPQRVVNVINSLAQELKDKFPLIHIPKVTSYAELIESPYLLSQLSTAYKKLVLLGKPHERKIGTHMITRALTALHYIQEPYKGAFEVFVDLNNPVKKENIANIK